ncbi:dihydroorotate dehydrogenase [Skermania sp. ID1734]|nr:dihydroorotate dehydrogenase [Skermania sp. ID1734]
MSADDASDEFDYVPLRLPPDVTRVSASMRLAIQAEFGGWELSRVRLYNDGSRRVLLKRRKLRGEDGSEHWSGPATPSPGI